MAETEEAEKRRAADVRPKEKVRILVLLKRRYEGDGGCRWARREKSGDESGVGRRRVRPDGCEGRPATGAGAKGAS